MAGIGSAVYEPGRRKTTSQGKRINCKKGSMNKHKKRSFKPYNGQGK